MGKITYKIDQTSLDVLDVNLGINDQDKYLIDSYQINTAFIPKQHRLELLAYASDGGILRYVDDYISYRNDSSLGNKEESLSALEVNPSADASFLGFPNGDIYLRYCFLDDILNSSKRRTELYIDTISSDRRELRALIRKDSDEDVEDLLKAFLAKLEASAYFPDIYLTSGPGEYFRVINVKSEVYRNQTSIIFRLYEPLPSTFTTKDIVSFVEKVIDDAVFEVQATEEPDPVFIPTLKGPNFNVEVSDENNNPTEYLNYNELFSYPVSNSYYEVYSLFNEKSAQISIDHSDYSSFIHFSSAEERLRNFKYKLDLITSYNESIDLINNTGYTLTGTSGSIGYYEGLITGIVNNFDHYERFLYFETGSTSWPKTNTTRPYTLDTVNTGSWYANQTTIASNYDNSNLDVLTNTIPEFIREDSRNTPLIMFMHMLGQHFDNLWIYQKAVADKYDADNRLNFGISKDLVREALESFGVKLYNSNLSLGQLFSMFVGEAYDQGSEQINTYKVVTEGTPLDYLQPMPLDNYQKEVYKRIYHNLPLLTKGKGTERGLRALINCFGIPSEMIQIRTFGGQNFEEPPFYGPFAETTSSLDKVRLDATGSVVGNTLSNLTSIVKPDDRYSTDVHTIEIGVSHVNNINEYIRQNVDSSFDIDEYIGDPRDAFAPKYEVLDSLANNLLQNLDRYDVRDFVRLIKFFDNAIFRIVRDFVPARSNVNTGIVVKPHILDRSKAKQVEVSWTQPEYSGSTNVGHITGSSGDSFGGRIRQYSSDYIWSGSNEWDGVFADIRSQYLVSYTDTRMTPDGPAEYKYHEHEETQYDGEFSGSYIEITDGELNSSNIVKKPNAKSIIYNVYAINKNANFCDINFTANWNIPAVTPTPTLTPTTTPSEPVSTPTPTLTPTTTQSYSTFWSTSFFTTIQNIDTFYCENSYLLTLPLYTNSLNTTISSLLGETLYTDTALTSPLVGAINRYYAISTLYYDQTGTGNEPIYAVNVNSSGLVLDVYLISSCAGAGGGGSL